MSSYNCTKCEQVFDTEGKLRNHVRNYHVNVAFVGEDKRIVRKTELGFPCPVCDAILASVRIFKRHVVKHDLEVTVTSSADKDAEDDESDSDGEEYDNDKNTGKQEDTDQDVEYQEVEGERKDGLACKHTPIPDLKLDTLPPAKRRRMLGYNDAIWVSSDVALATDQVKKERLMLAELGHWVPLWYSTKSKDYALLSSSSMATELVKDDGPRLGTWHCPIPTSITTGTASSNTDLDGMHIIHHLKLTSKAKHFLSTSEFEELTTTQASNLNKDWRLYPQLRFYSSQLLAGAMVIDDGQAILINTIEPYSRDSSLDAHFERRLPGVPSSYPDSRGVYGHLAIVLLQSDRIKKLVIGTRTCNLLITSSIRLDIASVNIGPSTSHFSPPKSARIFLDSDSIELANEIMTNENTTQAQEMLSTFQLKQVRSKFDSLSTYTMCRASSRLSSPLELQPVTIWTLCEQDSAQVSKSQEKIGSYFFQLLAHKVIVHGKKATLQLEDVEDIFAQVKDTVIGRTLSEI